MTYLFDSPFLFERDCYLIELCLDFSCVRGRIRESHLVSKMERFDGKDGRKVAADESCHSRTITSNLQDQVSNESEQSQACLVGLLHLVELNDEQRWIQFCIFLFLFILDSILSISQDGSLDRFSGSRIFSNHGFGDIRDSIDQ